MSHGYIHVRSAIVEGAEGIRQLCLPIMVMCGARTPPHSNRAASSAIPRRTPGSPSRRCAAHTLNSEVPELFNRLAGSFLAAVDAGRWGTWRARRRARPAERNPIASGSWCRVGRGQMMMPIPVEVRIILLMVAIVASARDRRGCPQSRWTGAKAGVDSISWQVLADTVSDFLLFAMVVSAALQDARALPAFGHRDDAVDRGVRPAGDGVGEPLERGRAAAQR